MVSFFLALIRLSITGSIFAVAVMLLRLMLRKAPKWVFCMLWGLAALHLLIPVSLETDISLMPKKLASGQAMIAFAETYVGEVEYIYESAPNYSQAIAAGRIPMQSEEGNYVVTQRGSIEEPATVENTVLPVLAWVWLAGAAAMLCYTLVSYGVLRYRVATATRYRKGICQSEQVDSPFVLGLFRPVIYLPYDLSEKDMENVIAHERAHIRRKDHWWKPLGFLILSLYWFNPVMWLAYIFLCRDIEGACDEKVIQNMDKEAVKAYSMALLNCSVHHRRISACPLAFGEVGVKARIKRVMDYKKPAFWIILLAVVASAVAAILLLTVPAESTQSQDNSIESTDSVTEMTDSQAILALVDEIAENPAVAASSNPYDYISARREQYEKILQYADTASNCLIEALRESADDGLREYIMAAACAELTGIGQDKTQDGWFSGKSWLILYDKKHEEASEETAEDEPEEVLQVGSLLGVDCAVMRTVAVQNHPHRPGVKRYSYRFQYHGDGKSYDMGQQEWYLVEIHACLDYRLGDFDNDGIVELFYYTDTQEYPYYICDREGENLIEQGYTLVPDAVLDYELLLDRDEYSLYNERWAWILKDPVTYVQEAAKRPEERLNSMIPGSAMPEETDPDLIKNAYQTLCGWLDSPRTAYEKQITYKIMVAMEYSYVPEWIPGQINYTALFEKWGFTPSMSTEERNCYDQIIACFDIDPMGFIQGMEEREEAPWPKDMRLVADRLAEVNCVYDRAAYDRQLSQLENSASTDGEKETVQLLRASYDAWTEPALDQQSLVSCSKEEFWRAFCYAPDQVLRTLESANMNSLLGRLWGIQDHGGAKLMGKGYEAVNRALSGNPTQAMKDVAYPFLLVLEFYGGYRDTYAPGQWFNYQRLFEKYSYADAAFSSNCLNQMYPAFEGDPAAFFRALTQWVQGETERTAAEHIALSFAYYYENSGTYAKLLLGLTDGMTGDNEREWVQIFLDKYQQLQR